MSFNDQIIHGPLRLVPDTCLGPGILYVDNIQHTSGVLIENSYFYNGNMTTGDLNFTGDLYQNGILYRGSQWVGTANSIYFQNTAGAAYVGIDTTNPMYTLDIHGELYIGSTIGSLNSSIGSFLLEGGLSIRTTYDATSYTSGGGLTILGGTAIDQHLYARYLISTSATIDNTLINNLTSSNVYMTNVSIPNLNVDYQSVGNSVIINNSSSNFNSTYATMGSLYLGSATIGSVCIENLCVENQTVNNLIATNILNDYLDSIDATITNISNTNINVTGLVSSANIISTNATLPNLVSTNISSGTLHISHGSILNGGLTAGSLNISGQSILNQGLTAGSLNISGQSILNQGLTAGSLNISGQSILNQGLTAGSLNISGQSILNGGITTTNILNTGLISTSNIYATAATLPNLHSTNITVNNIYATNANFSGNVTVGGDLIVQGTLISVNITNQNIVNTNFTATTLFVEQFMHIDGTGPSSNSSTGSLVLMNGGLSINNTENAASFTSGGGLTVRGGLAVEQDVYFGGTLDVNMNNITSVATPINPYDAVNKKYVDDMFHDCNYYGTDFDDLIENTKNIPSLNFVLLTELSYDSTDIRLFECFVYVRMVGIGTGVYVIRGFYNGTIWLINSQSIGGYTPVTFNITTDMSGIGTVGIYKPLQFDTISVKYRRYYELALTEIDVVTGILSNNVSNTDIGINYNNNTVKGFKIAVIVNTPTKNALYIIKGLNKNGSWINGYYLFGDMDTDVSFNIFSDISQGKLQYTNNNTSGTTNFVAQNMILLGSQTIYNLIANTLVFTVIPDISFNQVLTSNFMLTIYVEVPLNNTYSMVEMYGVNINGVFLINTHYIGDNTNVQFTFINGVLYYVNQNNVQANILMDISVAPFVNPLCVNKGGTGNTELSIYSVLRGNGGDPIVGTEDFIYKNFELILGSQSKIILNNTEIPVNNSGGSIISNGGINIAKHSYFGDSLTIQNNVTINNTENASGLGSNGSFKFYGGGSILKDIYIGGDTFIGSNTFISGDLHVNENVTINGTTNMNSILDMNGNFIKKVPWPIQGLDAVNKDYVDFYIPQVIGNYSSGQVIIGTEGNSIVGYPSFTFDSNQLTLSGNLFINNTTLSTSTSAPFIVNGGGLFNGNVFINQGLDVNSKNITSVADPIDDYDDVNKRYLLALLRECGFYGTNYDDFFEQSSITQSLETFKLLLEFDGTDTIAFTVFVFVQNSSNDMSLYILKGFYNGTNWILNVNSIGNNNSILFYVTTNGSVAELYCYNPSPGYIYLKYRKYFEVITTDLDVLTIPLNNNILTFTNIGLDFINNDILAFKTTILINTPSKHSLYILTGLQKNGIWIMNQNFFGDPNTGVDLSIFSDLTNGIIQYKNSNTSGSCVLIVKDYVLIETSQPDLILLQNTTTFTLIPEITFASNQTSNFYLTIYVEVLNGMFAIYEIYGVLINSVYSINSQFTGDNTGIIFGITTNGLNGTLIYKNPNNVNAKIKYTVNTPPYVNPLCVAKGGTGNIELYPYAILRGNGQDPIISNSDLVFLNNELIVNGNASFSGDLDFGQVYTFNSNNGVSNESITDFVYNNTIRYFVSIVSIKITTSTDIIISAGQIKGVQLNSSWNIIQDLIGDLTGYTFSMSPIGQLKYTSSSIGNYISSIINFKTLSILKI